MTGIGADVLRVFNYLALGYFGVITLCYLTVTLVSAVHVRNYFKRRSQAALTRTLRSRLTPPVTICVSAYNEAPTIVGLDPGDAESPVPQVRGRFDQRRLDRRDARAAD